MGAAKGSGDSRVAGQNLEARLRKLRWWNFGVG